MHLTRRRKKKGYSLDHISLPIKGFKRGLRALVRYGVTPGHHVFVVCIVPAMSLSFAFATNADLSAVAAGGGLVPLLTDIVAAHAAKLAGVENASLKPALLFNPLLNEQLCAAPDPGRSMALHVRYSANKTPYLAARDSRLDSFAADGGTYLSLTDIRYSAAASRAGAPPTDPARYASPVSLALEHRSVTVNARGDMRSVYYVTERFAHGVSTTAPIVWDAEAYQTAGDARAALDRHSATRTALDRRGAGTFRTLQPTHGLLGEHLDLHLVQLDVRNGGGGSASSGALHAKVVSFRGRVYVRADLYDLVRRTVVPTLQDRVAQAPRSLTLDGGESGAGSLSELLSAQSAPVFHTIHSAPRSTALYYGFRPGWGWGYSAGGGLGAAAFAPTYGSFCGFGAYCPPGTCPSYGWRCVPCGG